MADSLQEQHRTVAEVQRDTFIVPLWSWHEHANRSPAEEAILFSMHDAPILKAFGLYREEAREANA